MPGKSYKWLFRHPFFIVDFHHKWKLSTERRIYRSFTSTIHCLYKIHKEIEYRLKKTRKYKFLVNLVQNYTFFSYIMYLLMEIKRLYNNHIKCLILWKPLHGGGYLKWIFHFRMNNKQLKQ